MGLPHKDAANVEPYHVIWCSKDGTNDGTTSDTGELQGATISTTAWAVDSGDVTIDSNNKDSVTIAGVSYSANTVATVWVSAGTNETDTVLKNTITTSDSRTLIERITIPVRNEAG